jgi:alcohol dehydrogenase (cytochrome c)
MPDRGRRTRIPGDNKHATSVVALDADTGKIKGSHQYHWNDNWDWDEVSAPLLVDIKRNGRDIKALVHPGRNGYLWVLERKGRQHRFRRRPTLRQARRDHRP